MHVAVVSLRLQLALAGMVSRRVPLCARRAPASCIYAGMSDRSTCYLYGGAWIVFAAQEASV
eukprot:7231691-Alexandrium_andersonii.AAC.1